MNAIIIQLGRVCLAALLAGFVACGGGSDSSTGQIAFTVAGLPAGLQAAVSVTGPEGFNRTVSTAQTVAKLVPGTYALTPRSVLSGTGRFASQSAAQSVLVVAGRTANVALTYTSAGAFSLVLQEVAAGLTEPVFLTAPAGDPRLFIVERPGRIRIVENGVLLATPFLDIASRLSATGEGGLLSMAFDPQYASSGFFFVYFTDPGGDIAIERFRVSAGNPNAANPAQLRILTITHRAFSNHKGGLVAFGPDGFLYLAPGDGGGGGDPLGSGQNLNTLLGKLLRIDVSNSSAGQPYAIPPQNPFVGQPNRRGEIWAYGLRNPWRYAFDATTGLLYLADVGQNRREEVDVAAVATGGLNYGWNIAEGSLCFLSDPCAIQGLTPPVLEYAHDGSGGCSITGGFVYRGSAIPDLHERYFYSDYCNGWLRSFVYAGGTAIEQVDWNIAGVGQVFSFGQDGEKELYLLTSTGRVHRIVRQ